MLEVKHLSKKFDGNYVLKDVSLSIGDGEVYGLIGANGSGKSTFMNILNGNEVIVKSGGYEGQVLVDGREVSIGSHAESVGYGIAMVHQELALFAGMTVTENIKINRENVRGRKSVVPEFSLIDGKRNREDARETLERIGSDLDPDQKIDGLSLNQKQFVELARELDNKKVRFLMLDEPTSSLNITETQGLLRCIREIADSGISVLFISHRLDEITEVCDRVSVLRDGELISTYNKEAFDVHRFADDMVGREIVKARRQKKDGVQKSSAMKTSAERKTAWTCGRERSWGSPAWQARARTASWTACSG
ncbi:MAG: ATP-binding cassette domain-containing protein [Lachnospiraceae bacterium]|nr:ATP-binding cassette domain-containing protein [Lachnospiraceae bacterium]